MNQSFSWSPLRGGYRNWKGGAFHSFWFYSNIYLAAPSLPFVHIPIQCTKSHPGARCLHLFKPALACCTLNFSLRSSGSRVPREKPVFHVSTLHCFVQGLGIDLSFERESSCWKIGITCCWVFCWWFYRAFLILGLILKSFFRNTFFLLDNFKN